MPTQTTPYNIRQRRRLPSPAEQVVESKPADVEPTAAGPSRLQIVERPIDSIQPSRFHARRHPKAQIAKIATSIDAFGFNVPILVEPNGDVIAGHARLEAAKLLGRKTVPVIVVSDLSPDRIRAFRIADNKTADGAEWAFDILKSELDRLFTVDIDLPELTGFDTAEIEGLFCDPAQLDEDKDPLDEVPAIVGEAVSRLGDLWLLGDHRIYCGDAKNPESYAAVLKHEKAQMVFTDPPYNLKVKGCISGLGKTKHREFVEGSGEMSRIEFTAFLKTVFRHLADASVDGSIHYTCISWHYMQELLNAGNDIYGELKNICCWSKTNGGMGCFYRSQHELIPVWKKGKAPHINNIDLGRHGRYRTNVWNYAGANTFRRGRMEDLAAHPTVKPTALVIDAIKDCSKPTGIVLDAFGGSGTTLIAAAKARRRGFLLELDPIYVDLTIRRWQQLFKGKARHATTGMTFEELTAARATDCNTQSTSDQAEVDHV